MRKGLTGKGHEGAFWNDGNVLAFVFESDYTNVCNYKTYQTEYFTFVHFAVY